MTPLSQVIGRGAAVLYLLLLSACVAGPLETPYRTSKHLIGLSESALVACAGTPESIRENGQGRLLMYHSHPTMMERSFPTSKGSLPCPHETCEALVTIRAGRVAAVKYRTDPDSGRECFWCERMFEPCFQ